MALKVLDASDCLMLSGESREEVDVALARYVERGSKIVTQGVAVVSRWTGDCTLPVRSGDGGLTDCLKLSDVREAASHNRSEPRVNDEYRLEAVGFKRIFTASSKEQVMLRGEDFTRVGASLVGEIVQDGDKWVAIVDTRGTVGSDGPDEPYRW
jgi:hypothetical protein